MEEFIIKKDPQSGANKKSRNKLPPSYVIEPGLLPETRRILPNFKVSGWLAHYPRFLAKKVHRNPRNLLSHVQRTRLHHALGNANATFGALTDLYLVLGSKGRSLRKNLLEKTRDLLSEDQRHFLSKHLDSGLTAQHLTSSTPNTYLPGSANGNLTIVNRTNNTNEPHHSDPLLLSREYIKEGDPFTARLILEITLASDPGQKDICKELLELYRDQSMRSAFFKTYNSLIGRQLALADQWRETEHFFRDQDNNG
jgi:hypothetical protein